jgi:hypothetical protein
VNPIQQAIEALEMAKRFVYADNRPQCEEALTSLRSLQKEVEGVLPEPAVTLHDDGYWTPQGTEEGRSLNSRLARAGAREGAYTADQLRTAVAAALGRGEVPQGYVLAPEWRGYALLGSGRYLINHSADFDPDLGAELIITLATDEDREGDRQIGESRPTKNPGEPIQADDMVIRIGFLSERGLFALEDQLSEIRKLHFAAAPSPEATQPTQAEAPSEAETLLDELVKGYREVAGIPEPHTDMWLLQAGRLYAALATQQAVQGEPVALSENPITARAQVVSMRIKARDKDPYRPGNDVPATPPAPGQVERDREDDIEAAAKKLAEELDYPWEHMAEKGRIAMRRHAQEVIRAARSSEGGGNV